MIFGFVSIGLLKELQDVAGRGRAFARDARVSLARPIWLVRHRIQTNQPSSDLPGYVTVNVFALFT